MQCRRRCRHSRHCQESSKSSTTVVVAGDTDLLVLLLFHIKTQDSVVYLVPEPKQTSQKQNRVWDIHALKNVLSERLCKCLLFGHAFSGCDTISRIVGLGKKLFIQKLNDVDELKMIAEEFLGASEKRSIIKSAGKATFITFGGLSSKCKNLDSQRYQRF